MNVKKWNRRSAIAAMSSVAAGIFLAESTSGEGVENTGNTLRHPKYSTAPLNAIVLGAGGRGNVYASYSERFPEQLRIVGVAEPIDFRRKRFAERYGIDQKMQWTTWEHAFDGDRQADILIITTPDHLHYAPAMRGIELGYDILLEKAIAQSWEQCLDIYRHNQRHQNIVGICHVLRYTPYFRKIKSAVEEGRIGEVISVQHLEPVEHIHMSHSFVRGNWRKEAESTPILLSKSCHDTDILRWIIGKPCRRISSFGSLSHFNTLNAPAGAPYRCTDGCPAQTHCPYYAPRIYRDSTSWRHHLAIEVEDEASIMKALREGPYGRCVFRCDNDVVDHQIVMMEFEDRITAAFSMEAMTHYGGRRTRIFGTHGDLHGDEQHLTITHFSSGASETWDAKSAGAAESGHGGGDYGLLKDFIAAVSRQDPSRLSSTLEASMESHLMGFRAEESRLSGAIMEVNFTG